MDRDCQMIVFNYIDKFKHIDKMDQVHKQIRQLPIQHNYYFRCSICEQVVQTKDGCCITYVIRKLNRHKCVCIRECSHK